MKKLISVLLALVMVLSLSVSAFAAYQQYDTAANAADPFAGPEHILWHDGGDDKSHTFTSLDGSEKLDVYYNFAGGVNSITEAVYSVTISWSFTLNPDTLDTIAYSWDVSTHKYVAVEGATATLNGGEIPVNISLVNNSNVPVDANCAWEASETYFGVSEHAKVSEEEEEDSPTEPSTDFETLSLPSAYKEGGTPDDRTYAYDLIDTDKTNAREDGKLVFKAGANPTEETYDSKNEGVAGDRFDGQWDRTIKVSLKDNVDYSNPYDDYAKNKIGTYTVTLSKPTPEESTD